MTKITESSIELLAIKNLESLGYHYLYGSDIAPDGANPERITYEQVLLTQRIKQAVKRNNPHIPADAQNDLAAANDWHIEPQGFPNRQPVLI